MGAIRIDTINRNIGSFSQHYKVQYRKQGDPTYIDGPTLNYAQAQPAPLGILPVYINIPDAWLTFNAEIRIVTVCIKPTIVNGDPQLVAISETSCGPR